MKTISKSLASQIVSAVKDVCEKNINFITPKGEIIASTDPSRVGTCHEMARQAAKTGAPVKIYEDDPSTGIKAGVNLPVYHNGELLAIIGISGNPDEVTKYAHLAEQITKLLIRESEGSLLYRTQEQKRSYLIQKLLRGVPLTEEDLQLLPKNHSFRPDTPVRALLIRLRSAEALIPAAEPQIYRLFQTLELDFYCFRYPREYLAVIPESTFQKAQDKLRAFAQKHSRLLKVSIGMCTAGGELERSYRSCQTAQKSIDRSSKSYVLFDELGLELLLSDVTEDLRQEYLSRTTAKLTDEDKAILRAYYEENMSLTAACERLFIHKNTLQYRLNRIWRVTGRNPRNFQDAVLLYLGLELTDLLQP